MTQVPQLKENSLTAANNPLSTIASTAASATTKGSLTSRRQHTQHVPLQQVQFAEQTEGGEDQGSMHENLDQYLLKPASPSKMSNSSALMKAKTKIKM